MPEVMCPAPIWLTVANPRKGRTVATTCDTIEDALREAREAAEDEDVIVSVEQGGRVLGLFNAETFDDD